MQTDASDTGPDLGDVGAPVDEESKTPEIFMPGPFTEPAPKSTVQPRLEPGVAHLCAGVAHALVALLRNWSQPPSGMNRPFNERFAPLVGMGSHLPDFIYTTTDDNAPHPHHASVELFVRTLAERWGCDTTELVVAVVLIERVVRQDPTLMQAYTLRHLLLAALAVAAQTGADCALTLDNLWEAIAGDLDALELRAMGKAQRRLLKLLNWQLPNDLPTYRVYAQQLNILANAVRGVAEPAPSVENVWG